MFRLKTYEVSVPGFDPATYFAASPGKARAACWRDYQICHEISFRDFLGISRVRRGTDPEDLGKPITVSGKPAHLVPKSGHYVSFVYPGEETILLSHPSDVAVAGTATA